MDYNNNSACSASSKVNYKAMGTKRKLKKPPITHILDT